MIIQYNQNVCCVVGLINRHVINVLTLRVNSLQKLIYINFINIYII